MTCVQVDGEQSLQLEPCSGGPTGPTLRQPRFVTFSCTLLPSGSLLGGRIPRHQEEAVRRMLAEPALVCDTG